MSATSRGRPRAERAATLAALRLMLVALALLVALVWWFLQKAPDYHLARRLVLEPAAPAAPAAPVARQDDVRLAWRLDGSRPLRLPVVVPGDGPALRLAASAEQGTARLVVRLVRGDGERQELATLELGAEVWSPARLPVPAEAGEALDLELEAVAGPLLVADPVLESEGRPVDETEHPVVGRSIATDLLAGLALALQPAPPTAATARLDLPGPVCLPLVARLARVIDVERVPEQAGLVLVLHLAKLSPEGPVPTARLRLRAGDRLLADLPVDTLVQQRPPDVELLLTEDLAAWGGGPLELHFTVEGGQNLFIGVRELYITVPRPRLRRRFDPDHSRNVLLVVVDGLRADRIDAGLPTPALDGLVQAGLSFTDVIAPSSWALPDVASLLTGVSPLVHGLGLGPDRCLSPRLTTLAQSAAWVGTTTALFTNGEVFAPERGLERGYEQVVRRPVPAAGLVSAVDDWLEEAGQFEWFATVHLHDPALPHEPAARDLAKLPERPDPGLVKRLAALDSRPGAAEALAREVGTLYDAEVVGVDRALGGLLDVLARRGLLERTLVAVVGSHGIEQFEHGGRGCGQTLFDEVVHVPLVLAGPGVAGTALAGQRETDRIALTDVPLLVGQLGGIFGSGAHPGRVPPPLGPRDPSRIVHGVLAPFPGVTLADLQSSRRQGLLCVQDLARRSTALYDLEADPLAGTDLLAPPAAPGAADQAAALGEAFETWYREQITEAAAWPVPWPEGWVAR